MREQNHEPRLNVVSGGPTKSDMWMQMHAEGYEQMKDVMHKTVRHVSETGDAAAAS